ncbi:protein kinase-like domain, concanavalin A-like lectin/glucanase domain protein [Tanacetum coccineum]
MVPLRSDTIQLVQNGCSFHELRFEDLNQHFKDFLKLVDLLDLDGENRERTRLRLFQFSLRDQARNWLECLPAGSITTWEDLTTHFLAQFFPPGRTAKLRNDILMFQQHQRESLSKDLAIYNNESWNDPSDFAKPVKAISLPQDVPSTSDRRLIELDNQVQRLMEAHLAPIQPTQVNKITTSCEFCSGPYDTQYCIEDPEQAFVEYASSRTDEAGGLMSNFMASQDARLSKFEADFKQQQSEMTNKIDTVLKAITDRMAGALPSDTVKNPKLNVNTTTSVLFARSYPTEDPQCSTYIHGSINAITIHLKQQSNSRNSKVEEKEREREGGPEDTNTIAYNEEQRDTPQLEREDISAVDNLGPNRDDEGIEWLDVEEPLDLVNTSEESVYELLIKEMPKCSLNYDFKIKKGDPRNLKIPCMIGHKFTANAYIDVDLPMNIMSLAYYNSIRKNGCEYRGRNFVGLGRDMHVFVGNMSYNIDFTILENIETNINPSLSHVIFGRPFVEIACLAINRKYELMTFTDEIKEITFKTPYKDPDRSELSSEGHDLLPSRVILNEDDYDRGCRKPSDLEYGFYRDTIKLGPKYLTRMDDEGEVT